VAAEEDREGFRGLGGSAVLRRERRMTGECRCVCEEESADGGVETPRAG
jgi:hypothetical protein